MKLCVIDNMATHYRKGIFLLMDQEYDIIWRFGEPFGGIKELDLSLLKDAKRLPTSYKKRLGAFSIKGVCKLIDENECVIMNGEPAFLSGWGLLLKYRLLYPHKKVYLWTHGWYGKETFFKSIVKKIYFRLATGVITYGDYARNLMINVGFNPNNLWAIHNSLDYDEQLKIRDGITSTDIFQNHFNNNNRTLIFIGRLSSVKRLDLLLDALSILKKRAEGYNLVLVGDGVMKENLEAKANKDGISENIWFYGSCYDEKKNAELIYNADLCVAPGNVGLTAIHTLMFGTPVATHDNFPYQMPEFEAIKESETGFFFQCGNACSIADGISKWFGQSKDRESIRKSCMNEIDTNWNPYFQMNVLRQILNRS